MGSEDMVFQKLGENTLFAKLVLLYRRLKDSASRTGNLEDFHPAKRAKKPYLDYGSQGCCITSGNNGGEQIMKYIFTDWDERSYERETKGELRIESGQISGEEVKISLTKSGKSFIDLILSIKESAAIISALNAANYGINCTITISEL